MLRVGDTYYMSNTTMHMSPGLPIIKPKDLVNWQLVTYAYNILDTVEELNLDNGKSTYKRGSWASSIRFHKGTYYVTTFAKLPEKPIFIQQRTSKKGLGKCPPLNRLIMTTPYSSTMTDAFT